MKKFSGLLLFSLFINTLFSQEISEHRLNIGVDVGIAAYALNDRMLNYFTYETSSFIPLNIHCYYIGENNIHFANFNYKTLTLSTSEITDLYQYNNINLNEGKLNYEYYHSIKTFLNRIQLYFGASYNLYITRYTENYNNNLWPYTTYQFSYDASQNLSLNALLRYNLKQSDFIIKAGYAILNLGTRPDDFYVKYGSSEGNVWKLYSLKKYRNIQISFISNFNISNRISFNLEYLSNYRAYIADNGLKFLKQSWLFGGSYKF